MSTIEPMGAARPSPRPSHRGATRAVGAFAAVAVAGLLGVLGLRVKDALAERAALAAESGKSAAAEAPADAPLTARGKPVSYRPSVPITGTLAPIQEADLGFKVPGRLAAVRVKEGDRVEAGALLASLDCSEASAQAAAATAGVRAAKAGADLAADAAKRVEALSASGAANESESVAAALRLAAAQADVARAEAGARLAGVGVESCRLVAPFGGLVTRAPSGVGKIVAPGEPLFHVQDTSVLELRASIAPQDRGLVAVGAAVSVWADGDAAPEGAEGARQPSGRGRITAVLGALDKQTRRVPVIAGVPNGEPEPLLAGSFVRATIEAAADAPALELPGSALRPGSQDEVVVVAGGKAIKKHVVFARGKDGALLVRDGLDAADEVLVSPGPEVRDGDAVAPRAAAGEVRR